MVADPMAYSTCRGTDGLRLCAYHDYADIAGVWAEELTEPFAAVAPQRRASGFTVVWREPRLDRLDPAVRERLDAAGLAGGWARDPAQWNGVTIEGTASNPVNRLALGLWSVELPLVVGNSGLPCAAGGQARGVIALWVAAQGKAVEAASNFVTGSWSDINGDDSAVELPAGWLDGYVWAGDVIPPVLWSAADISAAQALVALQPSAVRDVLWADWPRWASATTTTDELMGALGLEHLGPAGPAPAGIVPCT